MRKDADDRGRRGDAGNAPFDRHKNARHHGNACKQRAYRRKKKAEDAEKRAAREREKYADVMRKAKGLVIVTVPEK
jgi:hypothetical protein